MKLTVQFKQIKSSIILGIFFMLISPFSLATTPVINFWYGDVQYFGQRGNPQNWVNIIGNISFTEGNNIEYSVNGESTKPLKVGPDRRRLIGLGDFNIGIDHSELNEGSNFVKISVSNGNNELASKIVTVNYSSGNTWSFPYTADWGQINYIQNVALVAQVVDGLWKLEPEGIRVAQKGYDLTIAIGDKTWPIDYEVTVPFTAHSNFSGLGFALGWQGHTGNQNPPIEGPLQALVWMRGAINGNPPSLEIMTYEGLDQWKKIQKDTKSVQVERNKKYFLKARSESIGSGLSRTDVKFWAQGENEPNDWMISADIPTRRGSILLVANNVDMTFGNVTIEELNGGSTPNPTEPPVSSGNAISDDFDGELNTNLWNTYDPQGDTSITTTESQIQFSVPAGTNHDLWTNNLDAPRITQQITNTNFELEAKFDSPVTDKYQMQGIIVEQDHNNLLRFEFHSDGSTTNIFSASIDNGIARKRLIKSIDSGSSLYLRVLRIGNQWTTSYSYNGSTWNTANSFSHDLSTDTVGLFAGNSGNPAPTHNAKIDYFNFTNK
jgi:regulation of enolase protein 1 (concanavalin A-like superfamily)